jgi:hypothetical protein
MRLSYVLTACADGVWRRCWQFVCDEVWCVAAMLGYVKKYHFTGNARRLTQRFFVMVSLVSGRGGNVSSSYDRAVNLPARLGLEPRCLALVKSTWTGPVHANQTTF